MIIQRCIPDGAAGVCDFNTDIKRQRPACAQTAFTGITAGIDTLPGKRVTAFQHKIQLVLTTEDFTAGGGMHRVHHGTERFSQCPPDNRTGGRPDRFTDKPAPDLIQTLSQCPEPGIHRSFYAVFCKIFDNGRRDTGK